MAARTNWPPHLKFKIFEKEKISALMARETWIEGCVFRDVEFDRCDFRGAKDHYNTFERCVFHACRFQDAALGIRTSRFGGCRFQDCNFKGTVFDNAVFENTRFANCRLNGVDFSASGFWHCQFLGDVEDVVFRGTYQFASDLGRHTPVDSGLHDVDFSKASLKWITVSNGCSIVDVALPSNGEVFIADRSRLQSDCRETVQRIFSANDARIAEKAIELYAANDTQDRCFVTLRELKETYGSNISGKLFDTLKQCAAVP